MKSMSMAEVAKLALKHGFTAENAAKTLEKDGWTITGRKNEDPLAMASKKGLKDNGVKAVQFHDYKKNEDYHAIEMIF